MADTLTLAQEFERCFPSLYRRREELDQREEEIARREAKQKEEEQASQYRIGEMEKERHRAMGVARETEKAAVAKMTEVATRMKEADTRFAEAEAAMKEGLALKEKFEAKLEKIKEIYAK